VIFLYKKKSVWGLKKQTQTNCINWVGEYKNIHDEIVTKSFFSILIKSNIQDFFFRTFQKKKKLYRSIRYGV